MRYLSLVIGLCALGMHVPLAAQDVHNNLQEIPAQAHPEQIQAQTVEVVFVLDSTGSMGGLIAGAKERIWSIVNTISKSSPNAHIKIGLVSYRDRGDAYVTKTHDLTDDLDKFYAFLMDIQAAGGGDAPESVNQGLHEAVVDFKWTTEKSAYRAVFLVGDCPPHMDYQDDIKYMDSCKIAIKNDIFVNTVLCGNNPTAMTIWKDIAERGNGTFSQIQQSGGVQAVKTPFDEKMVTLSKEMDQTRVYLKSELKITAERKANADKQYEELSISSNASRAYFQCTSAGTGNFLGNNEVVDAVVSGKLKVNDIRNDELPTELQGKSEAEIAALLAEKHRERKRIAGEIQKLQQQRQAWIDKNTETVKDAFDTQIEACVRVQLKSN